MLRFALILAMLAAPVLGQTPKTAYDWLALAAPETVFGAPVTLTPGFSRENDKGRVSLCTATTEAGDSLALLYRATPSEGRAVPDLVADYRAELAGVMASAPVFEPIALGDAALWEESAHQLAVWSHEGKALMVFTLIGPQARERCMALAKTILAAGG